MERKLVKKLMRGKDIWEKLAGYGGKLKAETKVSEDNVNIK